MASAEGYVDDLDGLDIHLAASAGVLGRFRKALVEAGFAEDEAAAFALEWWRNALQDPEGGQ